MAGSNKTFSSASQRSDAEISQTVLSQNHWSSAVSTAFYVMALRRPRRASPINGPLPCLGTNVSFEIILTPATSEADDDGASHQVSRPWLRTLCVIGPFENAHCTFSLHVFGTIARFLTSEFTC